MSNRSMDPYGKAICILNDDCGQGLVEYALILLLIAMAVIVALQSLGTTVSSLLASINAVIN